MDNFINIIPISFILIVSVILIVFQNWKRSIIALAVLFLGSFFLFLQVWPFTMSAVKLITGWVAITVLAFTPVDEDRPVLGFSGNQVFRLLSLIFIWVVAFLISSTSSRYFQSSPEILFTAFAIFGCGLLQLGMTTKPFYIIMGILMVFNGFELLYASIETSILINGLLAAMNLLIALIGSYLIGLKKIEGTE